MSDVDEFVPAGTRIYTNNGLFLEVTNLTAVGMHGKLYQTSRWAERAAAENRAWAERSWLRKLLAMPPKGYESVGTPVQPLFVIFGSLF